uniref:Uncharacterized protein n=1 Tax=Cacopsylla melanoneura TaxID=428564 RepID=A0A8D9A5B5_9HEMI
MVVNISLFSPTLLNTSSFLFLSDHLFPSSLLHTNISKPSKYLSSFFLSVHVSAPYTPHVLTYLLYTKSSSSGSQHIISKIFSSLIFLPCSIVSGRGLPKVSGRSTATRELMIPIAPSILRNMRVCR